MFILANRFPGSAALVVQLLAAFFGLLHVAVICKLINYALRLRLMKASVSLDVLQTWVDLSTPRVNWDLLLRFFFPVVFMVLLSLVPAALWASSMTPSISRRMGNVMLLLPSYEDVSKLFGISDDDRAGRPITTHTERPPYIFRGPATEWTTHEICSVSIIYG